MVRRKVIQIADSTQLVSLPRKWALANNIKKGDELDVLPQGKTLLVSVDNEAVIAKTTIDISKHELMLERYLVSVYRGGYDEVEVHFNTPDIMKQIQDIINRDLLGFEIIQHGEKRCVIKNISASLNSEFDNILRRTLIITLDMAKSVHEAVVQGKISRLDEALSSEKTINKFTLFCERLLNKSGYKNYKYTNYLFVIVYQLEKIADEFKYICQFLQKRKLEKVDKDIVTLLKQVYEYFDIFYQMYYKYDISKAEKLYLERKNIIKQIEKLLAKANSDELRVLHNLMNIVQLTFNVAGCKIGMSV